jgi:hypothetical protein
MVVYRYLQVFHRQGVVRKPVGGGGNGYGGKKQRNGNEGKGESSGTAGIGTDIKLLPHSVRSLVYAARNYEFEVLGVQTVLTTLKP